MCYLVTTIVPLFNILEVTIEDVNFTVKLNFKEVMTQRLVPNHLVIDSSLQPDWQIVDTIRVALSDKVLSKCCHVRITTVVRIIPGIHTMDAITFDLIEEQIWSRHAVNLKDRCNVFLETSKSLRHDECVVDVLFD